MQEHEIIHEISPIPPVDHEWHRHGNKLVCISCAQEHAIFLHENDNRGYNNNRSDASGSSVAEQA